MKTEKEIKDYLKTVLDFYINYETTQWERDRILGIFESCLVILGVIKAGKPFEYKMILDAKWFLGLWPTKKVYLRKEYLREHLVRLVKETLENENADN